MNNLLLQPLPTGPTRIADNDMNLNFQFHMILMSLWCQRLSSLQLVSIPQVLQQPEQPDCEIRDFAESGIVFGVEYWIDGIDDGENRVDSDLRMIIWKTLKEHNIKMPYPQREVRIIS